MADDDEKKKHKKSKKSKKFSNSQENEATKEEIKEPELNTRTELEQTTPTSELPSDTERKKKKKKKKIIISENPDQLGKTGSATDDTKAIVSATTPSSQPEPIVDSVPDQVQTEPKKKQKQKKKAVKISIKGAPVDSTQQTLSSSASTSTNEKPKKKKEKQRRKSHWDLFREGDEKSKDVNNAKGETKGRISSIKDKLKVLEKKELEELQPAKEIPPIRRRQHSDQSHHSGIKAILNHFLCHFR